MKKKVVSLLLVGAMSMLSLTGCGEKVTAESLVDGAFEDVEYAEYKMTLDFAMEMSYSGMSVDMEMSMDMDVKSTHEASHMKGEMTVSAMGMDEQMDMEIYEIIEDDTLIVYNYDENYGWTKTESEVQKGMDDMFPQIEADMFEDLEMEEAKKGYEVTATLEDFESLSGVVGDESMEDIMGEMGDIQANVTMIFNEDKEIEVYEVVFEMGDEDEPMDIDGAEAMITEFVITMEFEEFGDDKVEIPDDVIDEAVDSYDDGNDDFGYSNPIDTEDDTTETATNTENSMAGYEGTGVITTNFDVNQLLSYTFDGATYTIGGTNLTDFISSTGWTVDEYNDYVPGSAYVINADDYEMISVSDSDACTFYIYAKNNTTGPIDITECTVAGVEVDQSFEYEYGYDTHDFGICGLKQEASYEEAVNIFGEPYSSYSYGAETEWTYYFDEDWDVGLTLYFLEDYGFVGFEVMYDVY